MRSRLKKWGNSLALRIPSHLVKELGIHEDTQVEVRCEDGQLLVVPVTKVPQFSLHELLKKVTKSNLHNETETGDAIGNEEW